VQHGKTLVVYAHLNACSLRVPASVGNSITAGQRIGTIGPHQNGAHLHFEVRTYGGNTFDTNNPPLIFINGWEYFIPTLQATIDTNLDNRRLEGNPGVSPGWDGSWSPGKYDVQCFTSASFSGHNGNAIFGYAPSGSTSPAPGTPINAFEYLNGSQLVRLNTTSITDWRVFCTP
jgi:murein DD-endopeptidase MepM/ murein hydrolase activator NlpD